MTVTTLRPDSTATHSGTVTGAASASAATSDDSDGSYFTNANAQSTNLNLGTFTLPAGNVVRDVKLRLRDATNGGTHWGSANILYGVGFNLIYPDWNSSGVITNRTLVSSSSIPVLTQAEIDILQVFIQAGTGGFGGSGLRIYEAYVDVTHVPPPTVSAVTVSPSTPVTTTRKPTIGWTYTQGSDALAGQVYFDVKIFNSTQYGAGGFNADTSQYDYYQPFGQSISNTHTLTNNLVNGVTYKAYVRSAGLTNGVLQWSAWAASSAFVISIAVPTPTAVIPAAGSTVTTSRPTLNASVAAMLGGSKSRREWQFATNSGFSTGLLTVAEGTSKLTATPNQPSLFSALPDRLAQGTWFVRARARDEDLVYGSYSAGQSFVVSHPGTTASRTPSGGTSIQYTTTPRVDWTFSDLDTDDFQTKYQVLLWKTSTPGTVLDSGLVTSTNKFYQFASGLDATWKNTELRWKVQVQDQDAVTAGYSSENVFFMRDLPVVAVTAPAEAAVITTGAPLVTWTSTMSGGGTQAQYKVDILRSTVLLITSGWVNSSALSWQCPTPVVTVGPSHQVVVSVIDSNGLQGSDTNTFTATYAAPPTPIWGIDSSLYATSGLNVIDWASAVPDGNFSSWKVLRRTVGDSTWTKIFETQTVGTRQYKDYLSPSQSPQEYVVVQVATSFGTAVESVYSPITSTGISERYILVCPALDTLNVVLYQVHSENFGDEVEQSTLNLIGRGRRIEYGNNYGVTGSLSSSVRDIEGGLTARQQRLKIEALRDSQQVVYLRNPFGDVFQVMLGSVRFDRLAGVGLREYLEMTLDYSEIS